MTRRTIPTVLLALVLTSCGIDRGTVVSKDYSLCVAPQVWNEIQIGQIYDGM